MARSRCDSTPGLRPWHRRACWRALSARSTLQLLQATLALCLVSGRRGPEQAQVRLAPPARVGPDLTRTARRTSHLFRSFCWHGLRSRKKPRITRPRPLINTRVRRSILSNLLIFKIKYKFFDLARRRGDLGFRLPLDGRFEVGQHGAQLVGVFFVDSG